MRCIDCIANGSNYRVSVLIVFTMQGWRLIKSALNLVNLALYLAIYLVT
ncbi:MAG: hypothetical protein RLZZ384_274 [Pseudomonadota bacterium]